MISVDGSRESLKATAYINCKSFTSRPIILCLTKIRETKATTRDVMVFCHHEVLSSFCLQNNLQFRVVADMPSLSYMMDTAGSSGSEPCPICRIRKEVRKDEKTGKRILMNSDEFYSENNLDR